MEVGDRVRLINDPGRVGIFTGNRSVLGGRDYVQVAFPDQTMRVPFDQVEPIDVRGESPVDLFRRGRLARPSDLYRTLTHIRLSGRLANFIDSLETTEHREGSEGEGGQEDGGWRVEVLEAHALHDREGRQARRAGPRDPTRASRRRSCSRRRRSRRPTSRRRSAAW